MKKLSILLLISLLFSLFFGCTQPKDSHSSKKTEESTGPTEEEIAEYKQFFEEGYEPLIDLGFYYTSGNQYREKQLKINLNEYGNYHKWDPMKDLFIPQANEDSWVLYKAAEQAGLLQEYLSCSVSSKLTYNDKVVYSVKNEITGNIEKQYGQQYLNETPAICKMIAEVKIPKDILLEVNRELKKNYELLISQYPDTDWGEMLFYTDEQIEAIYSGNRDEIIQCFMTENTGLYLNGKIYTPVYFFNTQAEDWMSENIPIESISEYVKTLEQRDLNAGATWYDAWETFSIIMRLWDYEDLLGLK